MMHSNDINIIFANYLIDNSIVSLYQFAYRIIIKFRDYSP